MDWLQTLLDSSTTPALTAFLLGLLTAISPCPLATNIAVIGFISKDIENRCRIFRNGLLYTLGRVIAYTILGVVLIMILKEGVSLFGIQKFLVLHYYLSGCLCYLAINLNFRPLVSKVTVRNWPARAAGVLYCLEYCSRWHSARPVVCSISVC